MFILACGFSFDSTGGELNSTFWVIWTLLLEISTKIFCIKLLSHILHTGWAINNAPIKKLNISTMHKLIELIFFIDDRGEFNVFFHKKKLSNTTSNHHFWLEYTVLAFFRG